MSEFSGAACVGQGDLFTSTAVIDHKEAAAICAECPAIIACRALAIETLNSSATTVYRGLVGTWAGQLHGRQGLPRPVIPAQVRTTNRTPVRGTIGAQIKTAPGASSVNCQPDSQGLARRYRGAPN